MGKNGRKGNKWVGKKEIGTAVKEENRKNGEQRNE